LALEDGTGNFGKKQPLYVAPQEGAHLIDMTLLYIGPNKIIVQNTMISNNKT